MTKFRLALLATLLTAAACNCGRPPVNSVSPDVIPDGTTSLSLEGCPVVDAAGMSVEGAVPTEGLIRVTNAGRGTATLAVTLEGSGAELFTVGEFDAQLPPDNTVEIPVLFAPKSAAASNVTMKIDDGDPETEILEIPLSGTGLNYPPNPTLKLSLESAPGNNTFVPCEEGFACRLDFDPLFFGQSATRKVRVENTGCAPLKIEGIELALRQLGDSQNLAFFVDAPAIPTEGAPILLNVADGTQTVDISIRFEPVDDDPLTVDRSAVLTLTTNDPSQAERTEVGPMLVNGSAIRPEFYSDPTACDFTRESDLCGNMPKVAGVASFTITNSGDVAITLDSASFEGGGSGGRFSLPSAIDGSVITASGGTLTFDVNYTDAPSYVEDRLLINASANGMPAGTVSLTLTGGTPPRIVVTGAPLNFNDAATGAEASFTVGAEAGFGSLTIKSLSIDELTAGTPNPFFSIVSGPSAGQVIPAGSAEQVTVRYTRPPSGGSQASTLRIATNDPGYPAPEHRQVQLYSNAPADLAPVAIITGPNGETEVTTPTTAEVTAAGGRIELDGSASYDDVPGGGTVPVSAYEWVITKKTSPNAKLVNAGGTNVEGTFGSESAVFLDFGSPVNQGEHRIRLRVRDSSGNISTAKSFKVVVSP